MVPRTLLRGCLVNSCHSVSSRSILATSASSSVRIGSHPSPLVRAFSSTSSCCFLNELGKFAGEAAKGWQNQNNGDVATYTDSRVLRYSPQEMYSIVSDVNSYSEFLPFCTGSKVIGPAPEKEHNTPPAANAVPDERLLAELGVGFKNLREQYTSLVEMRQGEWVKATALPHPLFQHLSTRWKFAPETSKSPSTRIDFELRYAFTSPLYTAVAGGVFKDLSVRMMESFEARAQTLYGRR